MRRFIGYGVTPSFSPSSAKGMGLPPGALQPKTRHIVFGTVFVMASALFWWYWFGFPLLLIHFQNGYPRFGTPPVPNGWRSSRYAWIWWHTWLLGLNAILPFLLAMALANNRIPEIARMHRFLGLLAILLSLWIFVWMSIHWIFACNYSFTASSTACNDARWCGAFHASAPDWCPNTGPFVPNVSGGDLHRSDEFFQLWLFSLLSILWALAHRAINRDLQSYGLFREEFTVNSF